MNRTPMLLPNALLSLATAAALTAVVRTVVRLRPQRAETPHPSRPTLLRLAAEDAERTLAEAA